MFDEIFDNQEKRTYTIPEIVQMLGISPTTAYEMIKDPPFRVVKVLGTYRISKKSFDEWLDGMNKDDMECTDL